MPSTVDDDAANNMPAYASNASYVTDHSVNPDSNTLGSHLSYNNSDESTASFSAETDTNSDSSQSFNDIEVATSSSNRHSHLPKLAKSMGPSSCGSHHNSSKVVEGRRLQEDDDSSCFTKNRKRIVVGAVAVVLMVCGIGALLLVLGGEDNRSGSAEAEGYSAFGYLTESPTSFPTISPMPTALPTKQPTREPTKLPTSTPTQSPTKTPTLKPTNSPTARPTPKPTNSPTARPTPKPTQGPTVRPTTAKPTPTPHPPTVAPPTLPGHNTFSFYVMGDVPYSESEEKLLKKQLKEIDEGMSSDDALFIIHVGDIFKKGRYECVTETYQNVADTFTDLSPIPVIVLPGDNDIFDCDVPDEAQVLWENSFIGFEQNWNAMSNIPSRVIRQDRRRENFAFTHADVLFLGLNIIGASPESDIAADRRFDDCLRWIQEMVGSHLDGSLRAVVFLGHANKFPELFEEAEKMLSPTRIPTIYIHGNGHQWEMEKPINQWDEYLRIQVDQGGEAPPIKVTIRGTTPVARHSPFYASDLLNQHMHGTDMKIDRRGGLY